jgi:hypothetical protein
MKSGDFPAIGASSFNRFVGRDIVLGITEEEGLGRFSCPEGGPIQSYLGHEALTVFVGSKISPQL